MTGLRERFANLALTDPVLMVGHAFQRRFGDSAFGRVMEERYTGCPFYDNYEQLLWSGRGYRSPDLALTAEVPGDPKAHGPAINWTNGVIVGAKPDDLEQVRRGMIRDFDESSIVQAIAYRTQGKKRIYAGVSRDPAAPLFTTTIQTARYGEVQAMVNRSGPGVVRFALGYTCLRTGEFRGVRNPIVVAQCALADLAQQYAGIRLG